MPKQSRGSAVKPPATRAQGILRSGASTAALAAAFNAALLAAASAVISNIDVAHELHEPLTTAITAVAALLSAYLTGKKRKSDGLAVGAVCGGTVFVALALAAAIFTEEGVTAQSLVKLLALVSAGSAGGLMGVSSKPRAKKLAGL